MMEGEEEKKLAQSNNNVFLTVVRIVCLAVFISQIVLLLKVALFDKELAILGLSVLFLGLFGIGYCYAAKRQKKSKPLFVVELIMSGLCWVATTITLWAFGLDPWISVALGFFGSSLCAALALTARFLIPEPISQESAS